MDPVNDSSPSGLWTKTRPKADGVRYWLRKNAQERPILSCESQWSTGAFSGCEFDVYPAGFAPRPVGDYASVGDHASVGAGASVGARASSSPARTHAAIRQHGPLTPEARKALPLCTGVLDYFPDALLAVAELSRIGNDQHNPGQPLHWAKDKSTDEPDALVRHLLDRGKFDTDGVRHSAKVAWRALAMLQREIEAGGA